MEAARVKIGLVTLKGGARLHVLHQERNRQRTHIECEVRDALDRISATNEELRGFSVVMWTEDRNVSRLGSFGSTIPKSLIPDYVRAVLLGQCIHERIYDERVGSAPGTEA